MCCYLGLLCQDVVLARVLDESTIANINSIIHANNALVGFLKDMLVFEVMCTHSNIRFHCRLFRC